VTGKAARSDAYFLRDWASGKLAIFAFALVPIIPVLAIFLAAAPTGPAWNHVLDTLIWDYIFGTITLVVGGVVGVTLIGVAAAWLVTMCQIPGRAIFEWALVLPLAVPVYVAGYAWADLLAIGGPIRDLAGPLASLLPDARSPETAIFVYTTILFPYVYIASRAAFASQSICVLEASRVLGASAWGAFFRVGLPLARPAIVAGAALAGLEIAADFGLADHFGLQTLGIGVFRAWFSSGDLATAARLASLLMLGALILLAVEKTAQADTRPGGTSTRWRAISRLKLGTLEGLLAALFCGGVLFISFALPLWHLFGLALIHGFPARDLFNPIGATTLLAGLGSIGALVVAAAAAWLAKQGQSGTVASQVPIIGYAAPGAVVALGVLALWTLPGLSQFVGLSGGGAILALALAYTTRFAAAGQGPFEAGLSMITPSVSRAASSLGAGPLRRFFQIDLPIAAPAAFAAALLVFVEAMKELPATLILRPLNFDTLAIRAHAYAADERLGAAAWPSLLIILVSLGPVLLLSSRLSASRAGS